MRFQRVGDGENPVEMQFIKWTAEGMVKGCGSEYSMTWGHTSVAGNIIVFR